MKPDFLQLSGRLGGHIDHALDLAQLGSQSNFHRGAHGSAGFAAAKNKNSPCSGHRRGDTQRGIT